MIFFFNYTFSKITPFGTSSQRFSIHDCKLLLELWKDGEENSKSQRFPCNHSYFLHWKWPIFVLSRERISEDFYVCLKIDYVFLVLPSSDFKTIQTKETQKNTSFSACVNDLALHCAYLINIAC